MALAKSIRFGSQRVLLGDRGDPETFTSPCGLTTLGFSPNISLTDTPIPDCDDPDLPVWIESEVNSNQIRITGSGILDADALTVWQGWYFTNDGAARNVRWARNLGTAAAGHFEGPAVLASYSESGERTGRWQVDIEIAFSGKPTWVATPA